MSVFIMYFIVLESGIGLTGSLHSLFACVASE